jgi:hypothetical protein
MFWRTLYLALLALVTFPALAWCYTDCCCGPANLQSRVGLVTEVSGSWSLYTPGKQVSVARGNCLPGGAWLLKKSKGASIAIAFLDGSSCRTPLSAGSSPAAKLCPKPLRLPDSIIQDKALAERILLSAKRLLSAPEGTYVSTLSRGNGESSMRDAILAIEPHGIDLSPVLALLPKQTVLLAFQRKIGESKGGIDWELFQQIEVWQPLRIPITKLTPGLYRILKLDSRREPTGAQAWILLVTPEAYLKAEASFEEVQGVADKWAKGLDRDWTRDLCRAYLDQITHTDPAESFKLP